MSSIRKILRSPPRTAIVAWGTPSGARCRDGDVVAAGGPRRSAGVVGPTRGGGTPSGEGGVVEDPALGSPDGSTVRSAGVVGRIRGGDTVGLYREHLLPRLVDRACGTTELRRWREQVTAGLAGTVLEIGFGSGLNMPAYPPEVTTVLAVEPASTARRLAERRIAESAIVVEHVALDGRSIPLDDASCDGALSTFTLCTIPDVERALAEIRRVLRPGGRFHFLEHGLSPDARVARWQRRVEPAQRLLAGGCHLTRRPDELVRAAGFTIDRLESRDASGPKPWTWFTEGAAHTPLSQAPDSPTSVDR